MRQRIQEKYYSLQAFARFLPPSLLQNRSLGDHLFTLQISIHLSGGCYCLGDHLFTLQISIHLSGGCYCLGDHLFTLQISIHLPGGCYCLLVARNTCTCSEPIRLLEIPTSQSLFIIYLYFFKILLLLHVLQYNNYYF